MVGQLIKDSINKIVSQFHPTSKIDKPQPESTEGAGSAD